MAYANRHPGRGSGPWLVYCDGCVPEGCGHPTELEADWEAAKDAVMLDSLERDGYCATIPSTSTPRDLVERLNEAGRACNAHQRYPWWPDAMIGNVTCHACGRDFAATEPESFGWWDPRSHAPASRFNQSIDCYHGAAMSFGSDA